METINQKLSHLRALYYLACADSDLSKSEIIFIEKVAEHLEIPVEELNKFTPGEPKLDLPDREYKIYALYHRLALIVLIDSQLSPKERSYCFNLGIKMGLHPNAVGEIMDLIAAKGVHDAQPVAVMNIFRKYLN